MLIYLNRGVNHILSYLQNALRIKVSSLLKTAGGLEISFISFDISAQLSEAVG